MMSANFFFLKIQFLFYRYFKEDLQTRMGRKLSLVLEKERVIETSGGISGGDLPRRWIESKDGDDVAPG